MQSFRRREEAELADEEVEGLVNGEDLLLAILAGGLTQAQTDMLIDDVLRFRNRRELAEEYGVSPGRAGQVLEAARRKIRRRGCFALEAAA